MKTRILIGLTLLTLVFGAQVAMAECFINGTITAGANDDPMGPVWMYTMEITWDTGSNYSLSHLNLIMDLGMGTCLCQGDPSIPEVTGFLLKFEPIYDEFCEPGPTGMATFTFYSDLPPAPINEQFLTVVDKGDHEYCFGSLTGEFPAMDCDPVNNQDSSWGNVKGMFR